MLGQTQRLNLMHSFDYDLSYPPPCDRNIRNRKQVDNQRFNDTFSDVTLDISTCDSVQAEDYWDMLQMYSAVGQSQSFLLSFQFNTWYATIWVERIIRSARSQSSLIDVIRSGSGNDLKYCFNTPVTLLMSPKKTSRSFKSTCRSSFDPAFEKQNTVDSLEKNRTSLKCIDNCLDMFKSSVLSVNPFTVQAELVDRFNAFVNDQGHPSDGAWSLRSCRQIHTKQWPTGFRWIEGFRDCLHLFFSLSIPCDEQSERSVPFRRDGRDTRSYRPCCLLPIATTQRRENHCHYQCRQGFAVVTWLLPWDKSSHTRYRKEKKRTSLIRGTQFICISKWCGLPLFGVPYHLILQGQITLIVDFFHVPQ